MASRRPGKIQDLNGMFIYHDPKRGTLFYDIFTKRAFVLSSSDLKYCLYYTSLLPIAVVISLSLVSFMEVKLSIAIGIGIGVYLLAEVLFRIFFFYQLPEIKNYKPVKNNDSFLVSFAKKYSVQRLIVLSILMVAIAICTILYGIFDASAHYAVVAGYVLSILCIGFAIFSLIAYFIKKKNNY